MEDTRLSLFESIIRFSDDAIITKDLDGIVTSWNNAACRLFGYTAEEMTGQPIARIIPPELLNEEADIISKVKAGEIIAHYETERLHKTGAIVYISLTVSPLKDKLGNILGASKIARDITRQKKDGEALQRSLKELEDYKQAIDRSSLVVITDKDGVIRYANDSFCQLAKTGRDHLAGQHYGIHTSADGINRPASSLAGLCNGDDIWKGETTGTASDDSLYWLETTINVFRDAAGHPQQYVAVHQDITARKKDQRRVAEHERFVKTITDGLPVVISYWSVDSRCLFANKAYLERVGKPEQEVIGKLRYEFMEGAVADAYVRRSRTIDKVLEGKPQNIELETTGEDGATRFHDVHYLPDFNNDIVTGYFAFSVDVTDIKRSEREVRAKNVQIEELLNNIKDGFIALDRELKFTYVNDSICAMMHMQRDQLMGRKIWDVFPADKTYRTYREIETVIETGQQRQYEILSEHLNRWVENRIFPSPTGLTIFIRDISERMQLETELRESEQLYRQLIENITDGLILVDARGKVIFANEYFMDLYQLEQRHLEHLMITDIATEPYRPMVQDNHALKMAEGGEPQYFEFEGMRGDGEIRRFEMYMYAVRKYDVITGTQSFIRDITEVKTLEHSLKQREIRYRSLNEYSSDFIFIGDEHMNYTFASTSVFNLLGFRPAEFVGKNALDCIHPDDREMVRTKCAQVLINPDVPYRFVVRRLRKDGTYIWCETVITNKLHDPAIKGLISNNRDITELKASELQLLEVNAQLVKHARELQRSNTELEQFAFVASHDLQEPLRMVTSFLTQIEKKYDALLDDTGRKYIWFAVDGAKRMRQIILDLLEFSRVGRTDLENERVDITEVLNEVLASFDREIRQGGATVTFSNMPLIQANRARMWQIFQNLVGNALKYTNGITPPVIDISCREETDCWQFSVRDNGIGIDEAYFDKVFIIFQRLHTKDQYSGTGMGLAITKKIIEHTGGNIWLTSQLNKGSIFSFTIPKITP